MPKSSRWIPALAVMAISLAPASAQAPPQVAGDFKLKIKLLGASDKPQATAELLYTRGTYYHFTSDSDEILIIEPARQRIELIDLKRRLSTQVSFKRLDDYLVKLKDAVGNVIEKKSKSEDRGDRIAAAQSRSLIEPKLTWTFDSDKNTLTSKNEHIEASAAGQPEPDASRLAAIRLGLDVTTKLGALRAPGSIPPFARLDAIAQSVDRKIRPTELNFLYRLSGPPYRVRWSYEFVDHLTDRERDAFARIARLRDLAVPLRLERYEAREEGVKD